MLDYASTIIYTTRLLRKLHQHLSRFEQLELLTTLQRVVLKSNSLKANTGPVVIVDLDSSQNGSDVLVKSVGGSVCGVPVCRKVVVLKQAARRVPFFHDISELSASISKKAKNDPFIYNPHAKRGDILIDEITTVRRFVLGRVFYLIRVFSHRIF